MGGSSEAATRPGCHLAFCIALTLPLSLFLLLLSCCPRFWLFPCPVSLGLCPWPPPGEAASPPQTRRLDKTPMRAAPYSPSERLTSSLSPFPSCCLYPYLVADANWIFWPCFPRSLKQIENPKLMKNQRVVQCHIRVPPKVQLAFERCEG